MQECQARRSSGGFRSSPIVARCYEALDICALRIRSGAALVSNSDDPLHALRGLVRNWTACAQHLLRIAARPFLTVDARWLNTDTRASVSTPNVGFWPDADIPQRQLLRRLFGVKRTRYAKRRETGKE